MSAESHVVVVQACSVRALFEHRALVVYEFHLRDIPHAINRCSNLAVGARFKPPDHTMVSSASSSPI